MDVWAWNAEKVLKLGAPYLDREPKPNFSHQNCFKLIQCNLGEWIVVDQTLQLLTRIAEDWIQNPLFDLCHWYLVTVKRSQQILEKDYTEGDNDDIDIFPMEAELTSLEKEEDYNVTSGQEAMLLAHGDGVARELTFYFAALLLN